MQTGLWLRRVCDRDVPPAAALVDRSLNTERRFRTRCAQEQGAGVPGDPCKVALRGKSWSSYRVGGRRWGCRSRNALPCWPWQPSRFSRLAATATSPSPRLSRSPARPHRQSSRSSRRGRPQPRHPLHPHPHPLRRLHRSPPRPRQCRHQRKRRRQRQLPHQPPRSRPRPPRQPCCRPARTSGFARSTWPGH